MECFTCAKNAPKNTNELLTLYKKIYEFDKTDFYFFEDENKKISIVDKVTFSKIKKSWGRKKREFAHISEYKRA